MKRHWLIAGLLIGCAGFLVAQEQPAAPAGSNNQSNAPATAAPINPRPQGTQVTHTERDTIVQPTAKAVKVTPSVVQAAQQKLSNSGYNPGPADGVMGPQTRAALQKFQADNGLPQTGRLDQSTMAKLDVGGTQALSAAPSDLGRGGKALGHNVAEGHPVAGAKAGAKGAENFGKKVGHGTKSTAIGVKDKVGSGISKIGSKVSGGGEKVQKSGEPPQNPDNSQNTQNPPQQR